MNDILNSEIRQKINTNFHENFFKRRFLNKLIAVVKNLSLKAEYIMKDLNNSKY